MTRRHHELFLSKNSLSTFAVDWRSSVNLIQSFLEDGELPRLPKGLFLRGEDLSPNGKEYKEQMSEKDYRSYVDIWRYGTRVEAKLIGLAKFGGMEKQCFYTCEGLGLVVIADSEGSDISFHSTCPAGTGLPNVAGCPG